MTDEPGSREPAPQQTRDPRRNLAGAGFVLLGGWFAWSTLGLDAGWALRAPLLLVGLGVLAYGVAQLVRARR